MLWNIKADGVLSNLINLCVMEGKIIIKQQTNKKTPNKNHIISICTLYLLKQMWLEDLILEMFSSVPSDAIKYILQKYGKIYSSCILCNTWILEIFVGLLI